MRLAFSLVLSFVLVLTLACLPPPEAEEPEPEPQPVPTPPEAIIDVHLHALPINFQGPPPIRICRETLYLLRVDPRGVTSFDQLARCNGVISSPTTDQELMTRTLAMLEKYNVLAVTSGPPELVGAWQAAAPARIIPAVLAGGDGPTADQLRALAAAGRAQVFGELVSQYQGLAPDHPALAGFWDVAEELDVPAGIHMGIAPPGVAFLRPTAARYRASFTDPLLLEPVLLAHPGLRLYVMHAGWPMLDSMIHLLYAYPQVNVDVSAISWALPRREFHRYLKALVDAGFEKRIMFGSDQMQWPEAIELSIEAILAADFLDAEQREAIFYSNAVEFLRLSEPLAAAE